jgi:hypothetical protein
MRFIKSLIFRIDGLKLVRAPTTKAVGSEGSMKD